uniref:Uncharacterized protein n=1 Tax=Strongyloides stercoralis TaxID=6248 RepID=A0AAF5DKF7_STRER
NFSVAIDAPFDNCLDKSIEDEDSYSSTEYNGIASNVLHKTMVLVIIYERIEINIILSISNNLSNNKITSLDFGFVGIVIKNELMNNNDEHGSDSNNYYFDRTTEYCIKFEPKLLRVYFKLLSTIAISCSEEETELKVFSIYDRFNYFSKSFDENIFCAAMLTDIVYLCELICRNPEKYSTEMFKSLENLTNYSNDNLEYKNTYFKYLERLLEYITTENSDFSPLFEIFAIKIVGMLNSKIQINKSSLENLYFISEANIDFHGIKLFDLRKTIIFLLNYISNLLNTFTDCYSSFKHNKILQKKYKLNVIFQYILSNVINSKYKVFMTFPSLLCNSNSVSKNSAVLFGIKKRSIQNRKINHDIEIDVDKYTLGNTQVPNKKKSLTKSYYKIIFFFAKINDYITTFNINISKTIKTFFLYVNKQNKKYNECINLKQNIWIYLINAISLLVSYCKNIAKILEVYFSLILLKYQILAVIYIITKKLISLVPDDEQINLKNKF